MNSRAVWAIARKDIRAIAANMQVWLPTLMIPAILGVIMPAAILIVLTVAPETQGSNMQSLYDLLDRLPTRLQTTLAALPQLNQKFAYLLINYLFAPFFLIIPLMTASVISADSFAGEKERGTLEGLLLAPVDLLSLLTGKALAAFLPAMAVSLLSFVLYGLTANLAGWGLFGRIFFPELNWLPLILLVIPGLALGAILFTVFISARVASFQAAYQLGALAILPALVLLFGQISGVLLLDFWVLTIIGAVLLAFDVALLRLFLEGLDRGRLFESQIR